MSNSQTTASPIKSWLVWVAAAALTTGLVVSAAVADSETTVSTASHGCTITGRVAASKGISVVWIEATSGKTFPKPTKPFVLSQQGLRFVPHVLAVPAETTVDFLNGDEVQHSIFWPAISGNQKLSHSLGTWPKGQTRAFQFTTPGIVPLLCIIHPEMSAYIIVTPTPYLGESDEAGNFQIADVPEGKYTLTAWHEGYKTQSKTVTLQSDGVRINFRLDR